MASDFTDCFMSIFCFESVVNHGVGHCRYSMIVDVRIHVRILVGSSRVQNLCHKLCALAGDGSSWTDVFKVCRVHIGTTQFLNAVIQKRHLARVAVIRLCGPASTDLPPYADFPPDLKQVSGSSLTRLLTLLVANLL